MRRLLLGIALVLVGTWAVARITSPEWLLQLSEWIGRLGVVLIAIPLLAAYVAAATYHAVRPRRVFVGEQRASAQLVAYGVTTGFVLMVLTALGLAFLDRWLADTWIVAASSATATLVAVAALPRWRPGHCPYCNYDQRGATPASEGRCSECGACFSARFTH